MQLLGSNVSLPWLLIKRGALALLLSSCAFNEAAAQNASKVDRSSEFSVGLGVGRLPFDPLPNSRTTKPLRAILSIGGGTEFRRDLQWYAEGQLGFSPGVCSDVCPGAGVLGAVAVQRRIIDDAPERVGLAVGPALYYSSFDGANAGVGVRMDFGFLRGVGPKLGTQYGILSSGKTVATVHLMIRLGN